MYELLSVHYLIQSPQLREAGTAITPVLEGRETEA